MQDQKKEIRIAARQCCESRNCTREISQARKKEGHRDDAGSEKREARQMDRKKLGKQTDTGYEENEGLENEIITRGQRGSKKVSWSAEEDGTTGQTRD